MKVTKSARYNVKITGITPDNRRVELLTSHGQEKRNKTAQGKLEL